MSYRNHFLAALDGPDLAFLEGDLTELNLPEDEVLIQPWERAESVYFPSSCVISVVTIMRDGRSVEVSTVGFESVVGGVLAISAEPAHAQAFVQVGGMTHKMPAAKLRSAVETRPGILHQLMRHVQQDIAMAEQLVACNALHDARARLARSILVTADRVGSTTVPMIQEYLAVMVGVQRTTVTAAAQSLKSAGLISYMRGKIKITDRPGLEKAACECYGDGMHSYGAHAAVRRQAQAELARVLGATG